MRTRLDRFAISFLTVAALFVATDRAEAGSHLWDLSEIYSNADGTIQFIELFQPTSACCEVNMSGKWVRALNTGNQFDFPTNLTGNTAFRHMLLATSGFAALPGAPPVDFILPDNFFATGGDTIELFLYDALSTPTIGLPLDGVNSLHKDPATGTWSIATNSPTNYDGTAGAVDAGGPTATEMVRGDANQNGNIEIADAITALGYLFQGVIVTCESALDVDASGGTDIGDAIQLLGYLFSGGPAPQAPFPDCGPDPAAAGTTTCAEHDACP